MNVLLVLPKKISGKLTCFCPPLSQWATKDEVFAIRDWAGGRGRERLVKADATRLGSGDFHEKGSLLPFVL
jgi:hypothetical protein